MEAKENKAGIWASKFENPERYRKKSNKIRIIGLTLLLSLRGDYGVFWTKPQIFPRHTYKLYKISLAAQ